VRLCAPWRPILGTTYCIATFQLKVACIATLSHCPRRDALSQRPRGVWLAPRLVPLRVVPCALSPARCLRDRANQIKSTNYRCSARSLRQMARDKWRGQMAHDEEPLPLKSPSPYHLLFCRCWLRREAAFVRHAQSLRLLGDRLAG